MPLRQCGECLQHYGMTSHAPFLTAGLGGYSCDRSMVTLGLHPIRRRANSGVCNLSHIAWERSPATVWLIATDDGPGACAYVTPNSTARSLRNVSASPINRSISAPLRPPEPFRASGQAWGIYVEVPLGLRRDISHPSFSLEFDDELPGCAYPVTIENRLPSKRAIECKPQLHRVAFTRRMRGPALRKGRGVIVRHRALATKMVAT